eukprot:s4544_g5.t1
MLAATKYHHMALTKVSPELQEDPAFWKSVVQEIDDGWRTPSLQVKLSDPLPVGELLRRLREKKTGLAYVDYGPSSLCDNPEVMLAAVKQNVEVLSYGTKKEPEIVEEAVRRSWKAVEYAANVNAASIVEAVKQDWRAISLYMDHFYQGPTDDLSKLIESNPQIVRDERLNGNAPVMLKAVRQEGSVLRYATEELRDDDEIVFHAVAQTWRAMEFASLRLKGNEDLVNLAIRQEGLALQHAAPAIRGNARFVMMAMKRNMAAFRFAAKFLHEDTKFWDELVRKFPTAWVRWMRYGRGEPSPGF